MQLLYEKQDFLGYDLQKELFKDLSAVNELFDLDGAYLSERFDVERITPELKQEYMNTVGSYLSNSLEDQYIKTVVKRAEKALAANKNKMNDDEVYIFSDSIKIPNPFGLNFSVNYTTLVTKNGSMVLSPGVNTGIGSDSLLPFTSEVYTGPVKNINLNQGNIDNQIINILRGTSGSISGSMFTALTVSFAKDGTISNYGTGLSTDVLGGNVSLNNGRYIGNIKDYR